MTRSDVVTIDFRKYPDTPHWRFDMYWLGEDDHGVWLWAPEGSKAQRGAEPPKHFRGHHVKLIQEDSWWTAIWNHVESPERREELYVDIATPPEWMGNSVRMIDLDLDIARFTDGSVEVLDEDEFEEHRVALDYPEHLVDRARTTTARLFLEVSSWTEPFGSVAETWMHKALTLDRPKL